MTKRDSLESRQSDLQHLKLRPAVASLQTIVPGERRDVPARKALLRRIRSEFEEMPGLSLTLVQAAKLFGIPPEACSRILVRMTEEGLLGRTHNGSYVLRPRGAEHRRVVNGQA